MNFLINLKYFLILVARDIRPQTEIPKEIYKTHSRYHYKFSKSKNFIKYEPLNQSLKITIAIVGLGYVIFPLNW